MKKKIILTVLLVLLATNVFAYSLQGSLMEAFVTNNQNRIINVLKNKPDLEFFDKAALYENAMKNNYSEKTVLYMVQSSVCIPPESQWAALKAWADEKGYTVLSYLMRNAIDNPKPYLSARFSLDLDDIISRLEEFAALNNYDEIDPFENTGIVVAASDIETMTISFTENGAVNIRERFESGKSELQTGKIISFDPFTCQMEIQLGDFVNRLVFRRDYSNFTMNGILSFIKISE